MKLTDFTGQKVTLKVNCARLTKLLQLKIGDGLNMLNPPEMLMRATNFPNSIEIPLSPLSRVARNGFLTQCCQIANFAVVQRSHSPSKPKGPNAYNLKI